MFRLNKLSEEKGFTMTELLVVMIILSILIVPMFRTMEITYGSVSEENETQRKRESFRLATATLMEDLLLAESVHVENNGTYDVLAFTTVSGESKTIIFDDESGMSFIDRNGERVNLSEGEKFEANRERVYFDGDSVFLNFYARELNVLLYASIRPRLTGGE